MKATYNSIIGAFRYFAIAHKQLHSFYCGRLVEFQPKPNIYPAMIIVPQPSIVGYNSTALTFNCIIMDIVNRDSSNLDEIHSDCLLIMADFMKYLETYSQNDYLNFRITETDVAIEPFFEEIDDICAGWTATFTVQYSHLGDCIM